MKIYHKKIYAYFVFYLYFDLLNSPNLELPISLVYFFSLFFLHFFGCSAFSLHSVNFTMSFLKLLLIMSFSMERWN